MEGRASGAPNVSISCPCDDMAATILSYSIGKSVVRLVDKAKMSSIIGMFGRSWTMHRSLKRSGEIFYSDVQIRLCLCRENKPHSRVGKSIGADSEATFKAAGHDKFRADSSGPLPFTEYPTVRWDIP
jgi:hypothetical protein